MRILAVDTTSDRVKIAFGDGAAAVSRSVLARGTHDEKLFAEIERLLKKAKRRLKDVDAIAVASGPGSFTGIRVGMTFAAVLAQALNKPAAAVTLLEAEAARAWRALEKKGAGGVAAVYPSSKEELFFQVFVPKKGKLAPAAPPRWVPAEAWPKAFRDDCGGRSVVLAGPSAEDAARRLGAKRPETWKGRPLGAADLIGPAIRKLEAGKTELSPLYLKPAYYERNPPRLVR